MWVTDMPRIATLVAGVSAALLGAACANGSRLHAADARAIDLARRVPGVSRIESYPGHFGWQVVMWCKKRGGPCPRITGEEDPKAFPIRVVCYCDREANAPRGWFIEANLATNSAEAISGNHQLQAIYQLP